MNVFGFIYRHAILLPFLQLYVQGPTLSGYGFYGGRDETFICASKTTMSQFFWEHHPAMCREIIERDANSLIMTIVCLMYFYLLIHLCLILQTVMQVTLKRMMLGDKARRITRD
jgi:hypothetical protein